MTSPFDRTGIFMNSEIISKIPKSKLEEIRISVLKNNKIDVRSYVYFPQETEPKPTKKGVWLSFKHLPKVFAALKEMIAAKSGSADPDVALEEGEKSRLKIYSADFRGVKLAHIRSFYLDEGEFKPGKGVSFPVALAPKILEGLEKLKDRE